MTDTPADGPAEKPSDFPADFPAHLRPDTPTTEKPQPTTAAAATLLPDSVQVDSMIGPPGYYVQAHDGSGRAVFDSRGYPVLVRDKDQKPGLNSTRVLRALLYIQIALILFAIVVGIIMAVELHHIASPDTAPTSNLFP